MPRVNIYLPEDLGAAVKAAELEVSAVCQNALREAVEAKERGVSAQIALLMTAMRLRQTTPEGRYDMGAADGQRWVRESATAKDMRELDLVRIQRLDGGGDEDVLYSASWADDPGSNSHLELNGFETLTKWLAKEGRTPLYGDDNETSVEADEYLAGFVEAAQSAWRELRPLVDKSEVVLTRRIELLAEMERDMLLRAPDGPHDRAATTAPQSETE